MARKTVNELHATAYHEAGHAVMAWLVGRSPGRTTIKPDGDFLGMAEWRAPSLRNPDIEIDTRTRIAVEKRVMVAFAGLIAEQQYLRRPVKKGHERDYESAYDMVEYLASSPKEVGPYLNWLWVRAEAKLARHRALVAVVAQALLRRETLTDKEVATLIKEWLDRAHPYNKAGRQ